MDDPLRTEVSDLFDADPAGSPPDVYIHGTTGGGPRRLLDPVRERGRPHRHPEGDDERPVPRAAAVLARPAGAGRPGPRADSAHGAPAVSRSPNPGETGFGVHVRELRGRERPDRSWDLPSSIGRRPHRPVLMYPEGASRHPLLGHAPAEDRTVRVCGPGPVHAKGRP
ncbi:hypothetical protein [Nocardiopsis dassonvillei]|uniref:hypothetical protein n=1 Tax=Nocardiopsis dassonvillei TaxID=2014 RepID=UPI003F542F85